MPLFLKQKRFRRKKRLKCSPDNKHCMTVLRPMLLIRIKKRSLDRKWDSRTDQRMSVFDTNNCGRWNETRPQNEKLSKLLIGQFFLSRKTDEFQLVAKDVQLLSKSDCGFPNLQKPVVKFRTKKDGFEPKIRMIENIRTGCSSFSTDCTYWIQAVVKKTVTPMNNWMC